MAIAEIRFTIPCSFFFCSIFERNRRTDEQAACLSVYPPIRLFAPAEEKRLAAEVALCFAGCLAPIQKESTLLARYFCYKPYGKKSDPVYTVA
jgi:hypothetical protein